MKLSDHFNQDKNQRGMTLIEMLIAIAIFVLIFSLSMFTGFLLTKQMRVNSSDVALENMFTTALRRAQTGESASSWGVYIPYDKIERTTEEIIVFAGDSYETRDASLDVSYTFPSTVYFEYIDFSGAYFDTGDDFEIVFDATTGQTSQYGSVTIELYEEQRQIVITPQGFITREY
jgi:prepilin-type N-terminal cleavage/methylation domain-containing protein